MMWPTVDYSTRDIRSKREVTLSGLISEVTVLLGQGHMLFVLYFRFITDMSHQFRGV